MTIALFDFDGTITKYDSLIKFIRFVVGDAKTLWGMIYLSPMLITYKLKLIPNYKAKQIMLSYFFKGTDEQQFQQAAQEYSLKYIDTILRPEAMKNLDTIVELKRVQKEVTYFCTQSLYSLHRC
jgi:phosphoserine phosphatase